MWLRRRCPLKNFKMAAIYGGHLGYQNGMNLAILNLDDATKFRFNLTYDSG